jgi:hypothetical protein
MATTINYEKHIWEGWTVGDFVKDLQWQFDAFKRNIKKENLKRWCMDNQPYYKKHIPEVYKHFLQELEGVK